MTYRCRPDPGCREDGHSLNCTDMNMRDELSDLRALAGELAEDHCLVARGLNTETGIEYEVLHVPVETWLRAQRWKRGT